MAVSTTAGSKVFVGPVTPIRDIDFTTEASALADFTALTGWLEVKEAENLGEHGDNANPVNFTSVGDRRVRKLSGSFDAGTMTIGCGRDPLDPGQRAMVAAQKDQFDRAFKIVYADAEDEDLTDSVEYFIGKVQSRGTNMGGSDQVTMITFNVGINSEIIEAVSKPITP